MKELYWVNTDVDPGFLSGNGYVQGLENMRQYRRFQKALKEGLGFGYDSSFLAFMQDGTVLSAISHSNIGKVLGPAPKGVDRTPKLETVVDRHVKNTGWNKSVIVEFSVVELHQGLMERLGQNYHLIRMFIE